MLIIPAIDLKGQRCVRLTQGQMQAETVYSEDPAAVARRWVEAGAQWLHVVDLDAAVQGHSHNRDCMARIIRSVHIPVQVGGGMRELRTVAEYLGLGAQRVILGTAAIQKPGWIGELCRDFPGRIVAGIDARHGRVATHGWTQTSDILAVDLARRMQDAGVSAIIFTDIHRDGMQTGPNVEETLRLAESVEIPVIASGGVGSLDHLRSLLPLEAAGVTGVIVGKALYSGALRFEEALALTPAGVGVAAGRPHCSP